MGVIFFMSSQPELESEATSNLATELIYKVYAFLFAGSHMDISQFFALYGQPIRKLAHFTEFMILGVLMYANYREYFHNDIFAYPLLAAGAYAVSDEIHQLFVAGRYCSLKDMAIDTAGAFCGVLLYHLFIRWKSKRN